MCAGKNGIFDNIDTSERKLAGDILDSLVECDDFKPSLQKFFLDLKQHHKRDMSTDNFGTITLEAPEITKDFIRRSFIHVGESVNQKNIASSLHKVLEMKEIIYHAIAWLDDRKSIYVVSTQRASTRIDEKTRNKTAVGEGLKLAEDFVMVQISVRPTTDASHGHAFGMCTHGMRSYCAV